MKRLPSLTIACSVLFCLITACIKEAPTLVLNSPQELTFTDQGGLQTIAFTTNQEWHITSSAPWCKLSNTSGQSSRLEEVTVSLQCSRNEVVEYRSCTITLSAGESHYDIIVNQDPGPGMIIPKRLFSLESSGGTISFVITASVDYTISTSEDWVSEVTSKGITNNTHTFSIAPNETIVDRKATIVFKPLSSNQPSEIITIQQRRNEFLTLPTSEYEAFLGGDTIEIVPETNVEYSISKQDGADWLHISSLLKAGFSINVDENFGQYREALVSLLWTKEGVQQKTDIKIKQAKFGYIKYELSHAGELPDLIFPTRKDKIRKLALSGDINGTDVLFFRQMEKLSHIDLSDANIVEGGEAFIKYGEDFIGLTIEDNRYGRWATTDLYTKKGSVESIFMGMSKLEEILLPKNLESLGWYNSFFGCSSLKTITIPKSVSDNYWSIGYIFDCTLQLESYHVEEGSSRFKEIEGCLYDITGGTLYSIPCARTSYTAPNTLLNIALNSFTEGNQLKELNLNSYSNKITRTVNDIELINLEAITVSDNNSSYKVVDGVLLSKDGETLFIYPNGRDDETFTTPEGVKTLAMACIAGNRRLKEVVISEGVENIDYVALFKCKRLTYLSLPSTLKTIEEAAFQQNEELKTIICKATVPPKAYDEYVFFDVKPDVVFVPAEAVEAYKTDPVWKQFSSVIKALEE